MKSTWAWIIAIGAGLLILGLLFFGGADRRAYRQARGIIDQRVAVQQDRIDTAVTMATKAVDLALVRAGDLPSQQARADLLKQDIEEIGRRLNEAAELQGEAATAQLDLSIAKFDATMQAVDKASNEASDPLVKAKLDRIYGMLEATKEQITQAVLNTPKASSPDIFGYRARLMALSKL
jgi:parvulin-like peptidyl-prolyl isomerase